jgi:RNA polymerase sigma-70 factor (ECF subfamily)
MIEQSDSVLVKRCLDGDRRSYEQLVKKYVKPIYNLAFRMVNDSDDAADISQAVFVKAYENLHTFDLNLKFFSWLYRIAINEALNFLAKQKPTDELTEELQSQEHTPEEAFHESERKEIIHQALQALSPDFRSVVVLRHYMDLTYSQISATLGITEKKVKSRLFTARQRLRGLLLNKGL